MSKREPDFSHAIEQLEWLIEADWPERSCPRWVGGEYQEGPYKETADRIRSYVDSLKFLRAERDRLAADAARIAALPEGECSAPGRCPYC